MYVARRTLLGAGLAATAAAFTGCGGPDGGAGAPARTDSIGPTAAGDAAKLGPAPTGSPGANPDPARAAIADTLARALP